jgi:hypothetical protein
VNHKINAQKISDEILASLNFSLGKSMALMGSHRDIIIAHLKNDLRTRDYWRATGELILELCKEAECQKKPS